MTWFDGFEGGHFALPDGELFARIGGTRAKPPLVLLHGFPQSHAMWHRVAQPLRDHFFLVLPDLRGYGDSPKRPGEPDHANYSKRAMATDIAQLMTVLGCPQFHLCGHDRGARVAHRLAVDHPNRVQRLALIDIAPTLDMYDGNWGRGDTREPGAPDPYFLFARYYYHWFYFIQPAPVPERMIGADARRYLRTLLGGWGAAGLQHIEPQALADYERCFCRAESIHAACEDYRASAGIDLEHDRASRAAGHKICCDTLVITGGQGVIARLFDPAVLWQAQCARSVTSQVLPSGHFVPEECPAETAQALLAFFGQ